MTVPEAYRKASISTAAPERLVLALYDGAVQAVAVAEEALTERGPGSIERAHVALLRAQSIVSELRFSLDRTRGGELARSLDSLYGYYAAQLVEANVRKTASPLRVVAAGLAALRDAWAVACCGERPVQIAVAP